MPVEQLSFLDQRPASPAPDGGGSPSAAPARTRSTAPAHVDRSKADSGTVVESRYPEALTFLREHGPEAIAVLHVLAVDAEPIDGRLVVQASTRGLAGRLGFLSKDSVHRRLRQLQRAGVLEQLPTTGPAAAPTYVLHLDGTGITVRNG